MRTNTVNQLVNFALLDLKVLFKARNAMFVRKGSLPLMKDSAFAVCVFKVSIMMKKDVVIVNNVRLESITI